ncbi:hypothetical protein GJ496_005806 [Pomphorhynchus laevis]|nr:hypothetical protein GJ496_005806 [Pomphorhynchus laevis]
MIPKSRFRHVYGVSAKESNIYKNLKISKNTHDSNLSDVNQKFLAIAEESIGGGSFMVLKLSQARRIPTDFPSVKGHRAAVTDIMWNPFNPQQIASSSDDSIVRIWNIPEEGITKNLTNPCVELKSHSSRAAHIRWHTLAENIIASAGADKKIIVWDVNSLRPATAFGVLPDICYSIGWNYSGQLLGCTNKDRKLRIFDVRAEKVAVEAHGHSGIRSSKICFLKDEHILLTCGFSKHGSRQVALWDIRDMSESLAINIVDHGSGVMLVHYDPDLEIIYLIGKGDGNFRYYEIMKKEPYFYYLSEYVSSHPQRAFCAMPKLGLDFSKNEIARIYKLYATGSLCEPISIIVPRKSEQFQSDIYPDTLDCVPAMTAEEWLAGENRSPQFVSVKELQRNAVAVTSKFNKQRSESLNPPSLHHPSRIQNSGSDKEVDATNPHGRSLSLNQYDAKENNVGFCATDNEQIKGQQSQQVNDTDDHVNRQFYNTPEMLYTPITKRNSVLENVRKLEDTIKRFNNGTYSLTTSNQYGKASYSSLPRYSSTATWPRYEIEYSTEDNYDKKKMDNTQCQYKIQIAIPLIKHNNTILPICQSNDTTCFPFTSELLTSSKVNVSKTNSQTIESSSLSFWKSKHIALNCNNMSAAAQDARSEISKGFNRKVKEMSQVFERWQTVNENETPRKSKSSRSLGSKENDIIKSRKEVRFTDKDTNNSTQVNINTTLLQATPSEVKYRYRDSIRRKSTDKIDRNGIESELTNAIDASKSDHNEHATKPECNTKHTQSFAKTNDLTCSQVLHKQEKVCEHWKNVKDLNKRILLHEERIRQLEAKVNEFVSGNRSKS